MERVEVLIALIDKRMEIMRTAIRAGLEPWNIE